MDVSSLRRIERLNYVLGGALIVVMAFALSQEGALGVAVGVALTCANFSIMRRMVQAWLSRPQGQRGARGFFMVPKMSGLLLAVFLAIRFLPISATGLAIGFSVFLLSIAVETVRYISSPPASGSPDAGGADPGNAPGGDDK